MTQYDPPGITNPENVDALTHRQIVDAFNTVVANGVSDVVTNWSLARNAMRDSTEAMVKAVRSAVDGNWLGDSADAAVRAVGSYTGHAEMLADLFDQTAQTVAQTELAAVLTKSFLPPVVPVTADQTSDPVGYDSQDRAAKDAEAEARRIMQQRYVIGFQQQDARLPTFPPAVSMVADGVPAGPSTVPSADSGLTSNSGTPSGNPGGQDPSANGGQPKTEDTEAEDKPKTGTEATQPSSTTAQQTSATNPVSTDTSRSDTSRAPSTTTTAPATTTSPAGVPNTTGMPSRTSAGRPGGPGPGPGPGAGTPGPGTSRPAAPGLLPQGGAPALAPAAAAASGRPGAAGAPGMVPPAARGQGDEREKMDRKVDLTHERNTEELLGRTRHVPPVIGE